MFQQTANSRFINNSARCIYLYPNGRRCRLTTTNANPNFCPAHAPLSANQPDAAEREVGGMILEGHPVEIDDATKSFEILWPSYIAYVVTNESFALDDDPPDTYEGRRFRRYFQSRLLQQVKDNNRLSDEYPGPLLHFRIVCEHHLVDVISTQSPIVRRVNPREPIN